MKQCPKCSQYHSKSGVFCSRKCANSRVFSEEAKLKKSLALKGKPSERTQHAREQAAQKLHDTRLQKYASTSFDELGPANRRRRVFEEQNYCCNRCNISEWRGVKIVLELEHIDGNTRNNSRDNLEGLCPNCHSITPTWRGRNNRSKKRVGDVSDEFLLECLKQSKNIRQGLIKAGLTEKGANYKRAYILLYPTS